MKKPGDFVRSIDFNTRVYVAVCNNNKFDRNAKTAKDSNGVDVGFISSDYIRPIEYLMNRREILFGYPVRTVINHEDKAWFEIKIETGDIDINKCDLICRHDFPFRVSKYIQVPEIELTIDSGSYPEIIRHNYGILIDEFNNGIIDLELLKLQNRRIIDFAGRCADSFNYEYRLSLILIKNLVIQVRDFARDNRLGNSAFKVQDDLILLLEEEEKRKGGDDFCINRYRTIKKEMNGRFINNGLYQQYYKSRFTGNITLRQLKEERIVILNSLNSLDGVPWNSYRDNADEFAKAVFYLRLSAVDMAEVMAMQLILDDLDNKIDNFKHKITNRNHLQRLIKAPTRLPLQLDNEMAREILKELYNIGFLSSDYQLGINTDAYTATYIAECFSILFGLKSRKWTIFEAFWGINRMDKCLLKLRKKEKLCDGYQEIRDLFSKFSHRNFNIF